MDGMSMFGRPLRLQSRPGWLFTMSMLVRLDIKYTCSVISLLLMNISQPVEQQIASTDSLDVKEYLATGKQIINFVSPFMSFIHLYIFFPKILLAILVCCMLYVVCCMFYVVYFMLYVLCCIFYVVCCMLYILCCMFYVVYFMLYVLCCIFYAVCFMLYVLCFINSTVCDELNTFIIKPSELLSD